MILIPRLLHHRRSLPAIDLDLLGAALFFSGQRRNNAESVAEHHFLPARRESSKGSYILRSITGKAGGYVKELLVARCLSELAGDIRQGLLVFGVVEDFIGGTDFNQVAHIKKRGLMGHAHGLVHIVRDNHDGHGFA